jgi:DNA repair protein RadC
MIRDVMLHVLRAEATKAPILGSSQALIDYLVADLAHLPAERLRVLFLNAKNRLLRDEMMSEGSVNEAPIYPREIMRRALELGATALILAHNHPSGDPAPSAGDIHATRRIVEAGRALDIRVHDHVIVARAGWSSFRALGLIEGE